MKGYQVSQAIQIPPRDAFPQAPEQVWTATGKQLQGQQKKRRDRRSESAAFVLEERTARGMSRGDVAAGVGVPYGTVSRWENTGVIDKTMAEKVRVFFSVNPECPPVTEAPPAVQPKQEKTEHEPTFEEFAGAARRIALRSFNA